MYLLHVKTSSVLQSQRMVELETTWPYQYRNLFFSILNEKLQGLCLDIFKIRNSFIFWTGFLFCFFADTIFSAFSQAALLQQSKAQNIKYR